MNGDALKGIGREIQGVSVKWKSTDGSRREKAESGKVGQGAKRQRLGNVEQCQGAARIDRDKRRR